MPIPQEYVADYWAGPCGANIIHIRPDDGDEQWVSYAGGNPKAKKAEAGRAYIALTSEDEFWILVSLLSFKRHFDRAERFIVNADLPPEWAFKKPNQSDPVQAEDMKTIDAVVNYSRIGSQLQTQIAIRFDLGSRMLAKLGLAVGYKLLGPEFLKTDYAINLPGECGRRMSRSGEESLSEALAFSPAKDLVMPNKFWRGREAGC